MIVEAKIRGARKILNKQKLVGLFLGTDWLREFNWTLRNIENATNDIDHSNQNKKLIPNFVTLVKTKRTLNYPGVRIQLK